MQPLSPIACDLNALNTEERTRRQALAEEIFNAAEGLEELPDGYAFRFPASAEQCLTIAEFISLERRCCPFLHFILDVTPEEGPLWLKIIGGEEVKLFLRAELGFNVISQIDIVV